MFPAEEDQGNCDISQYGLKINTRTSNFAVSFTAKLYNWHMAHIDNN
jgi:hypothetical protein